MHFPALVPGGEALVIKSNEIKVTRNSSFSQHCKSKSVRTSVHALNQSQGPFSCNLMAPSLTRARLAAGGEGCQALTCTLLHHFFLTHVLNVHCAIHDELRGRAVVVQLEFLTLVTLDLQRKACRTEALGFRSSPPIKTARGPTTLPRPPRRWGPVLLAAGFQSEADAAEAGRGRRGHPGSRKIKCYSASYTWTHARVTKSRYNATPGLSTWKLQGGVYNPREASLLRPASAPRHSTLKDLPNC